MKKLLKTTLDEIFIYSISVLCIIGNIFIILLIIDVIKGNKTPIFIDYCVFFVQLFLNYWLLSDIKKIIKKNKDVI